jgi:large conductance mechanosensitive channel
MLKEFREFVLRGNVVDLAVGVVIGAAFGTVIASFVSNILTPVISLPGGTNFKRLAITKDGEPFIRYGQFINDVIAFLLIAAAVFFFVVKPINALMARRKTEPDVEATTKECPECASSIPTQARRCAFCTSQVA